MVRGESKLSNKISSIIVCQRTPKDFGVDVDVHDPWADAQQAQAEYGIRLALNPSDQNYDAVVLAVAHGQFRALGETGIRAFGKDKHLLYDLKYILEPDQSDLRL